MSQNDQPTAGEQPLSALGPHHTESAAVQHASTGQTADPVADPNDATLQRDFEQSESGYASPYADSHIGGADFGGFDFGGFDFNGMLAQAQAMQSQLQDAQTEIAGMTFTGTAGGGLVTASLAGTGDLTGLVIKPEAVDPSDTETLADLVVAAVRDAQSQLAAATAAKMGPLAGGFGF